MKIFYYIRIHGQNEPHIVGVVENFRGTNASLCLQRIQIVSCSRYLYLSFSFQLKCMYSDSKYLSGQFDS